MIVAEHLRIIELFPSTLCLYRKIIFSTNISCGNRFSNALKTEIADWTVNKILFLRTRVYICNMPDRKVVGRVLRNSNTTFQNFSLIMTPAKFLNNQNKYFFTDWFEISTDCVRIQDVFFKQKLKSSARFTLKNGFASIVIF